MGNWIMESTRRDPLADIGLWNWPTMTTRRCPGAEVALQAGAVNGWLGILNALRAPLGLPELSQCDQFPIRIGARSLDQFALRGGRVQDSPQ